MQPILDSVAFGKLAAHPARARPVRNNRGHPAHIADRVAVRRLAKPLQLGNELEHCFLVNVVSLRALAFAIRTEAKFEANNVLDYRLGVGGDQV
jgi:hypothetical protein